ncbi:unnamed protein product [Vitrella brassicaformis CCMP3155]|uniref:Uncharacterized protein n=1 Tax=Vitrella brassicaformis (strain CCMP3155) TaxID=1169540 RepID=A0A0G4G9H2_VITBC|nr:unnamed protein product [Vitrella brassicaformis CCMP3155]|eukprot:CEM25443.1 unnamed protein product [Vitrella brassicaformis CCMP3155]
MMVASSMQRGIIISASRRRFAVSASLSPLTTASRRLSSRPADADALLRWEDEGMAEAAAAECRRKMEWRLVGNSGVQCVMDLLRRWQKNQDGAWRFNFTNNYPEIPVVCVALLDFRIWCYDGSDLQRIPSGKLTLRENGKWDHESFRCSTALEGPASLSQKLLLVYQNLSFTKDSLANIMLQRSERHQKGEASIAVWAPLLSAAGVAVRQELIYEMTPVDAVWWWDGKRFLIQHKQARLHTGNNNGSSCVVLHKSAGTKATQLYDEGDFDLLAVSVPGDRYFYLIPMKVLVDRGASDKWTRLLSCCVSLEVIQMATERR